MVEVIEIDSNPAMSPLPGLPKGNPDRALLTFYEALKEVERGRKMTRIDWQDGNMHAFMKKFGNNNLLHIRIEKNDSYEEHQWMISLEDMIATDLIVL